MRVKLEFWLRGLVFVMPTGDPDVLSILSVLAVLSVNSIQAVAGWVMLWLKLDFGYLPFQFVLSGPISALAVMLQGIWVVFVLWATIVICRTLALLESTFSFYFKPWDLANNF